MVSCSRLKTFSTAPVHVNLKVDINEWETFPITELPKHSPVQHKSPFVSFDSKSFSQYALFHSDVIKGKSAVHFSFVQFFDFWIWCYNFICDDRCSSLLHRGPGLVHGLGSVTSSRFRTIPRSRWTTAYESTGRNQFVCGVSVIGSNLEI